MALRFDVKFVECAFGDAGDETFPDSRGAAGIETVHFGIPAVEAADNRNRTSIRRPHAEDRAGVAIVGDKMGSHLFVEAVVTALVEEIEILVGEELSAGEGRLGAHAG